MCTRSSDAEQSGKRTSEGQSAATPRHAALRGLVRVTVVIALLVALDVALCYMLEPYGAAAEVTWYDYRHSTDECIDTVLVGTSYAQRGLDPYALDEALGSSSFSLSTPAQALYNAVESARVAIADHHVKRVILGIGPNSLTELPWYNAQITFWQGISVDQPPTTVLHNLGNMMFDESNVDSSRSILWMFPWNFSNVGHNPIHILNNIRSRFECANPIEASAITNPDWRYVGRGHGVYDEVYDQTGISTPEVVLDSTSPILEPALNRLNDLCELCAQNGVSLYVVNVARPTYVTLANQGEDAEAFTESMMQLRDFCEEHSATYLDFNLAKPEFYRPTSQDFSDESHLNAEGSRRFCHALGKTIAALERGGNEAQEARQDFFAYEQWDEVLASYNPIEICFADTTLVDGELVVEAHTIARPDAKVEYEFEINGEIVQPYSTDSVCRCVPAGEGDIPILIRARADGCEYTCHRVAVR